MPPSLADVATLADAPPKWVLNTLAALGGPTRYSLPLARRLAVIRILQRELDLPLRRADDLAGRVLADGGEHPAGPVTIPASPDGVAQVTVNLPRLLAAVAMRQALLRTTLAPAQRGRPRARRGDPLARAADWGLDLSLLRDNLRRTPAERIRQLDGMASFARDVRRGVRRDARSGR